MPKAKSKVSPVDHSKWYIAEAEAFDRLAKEFTAGLRNGKYQRLIVDFSARRRDLVPNGRAFQLKITFN